MPHPSIQGVQRAGLMSGGCAERAARTGASRSRRRTKKLRKEMVLHRPQTRFLAVFVGTLFILFAIAKLVFLNNLHGPQSSAISQDHSAAAPADVNLKVVEVTRN